MVFDIEVNRDPHSVDVDADTVLLWVGDEPTCSLARPRTPDRRRRRTCPIVLSAASEGSIVERVKACFKQNRRTIVSTGRSSLRRRSLLAPAKLLKWVSHAPGTAACREAFKFAGQRRRRTPWLDVKPAATITTRHFR